MTQCRIENIAFGGEGVGRVEGKALFVPFTIPGELIDVDILIHKRNFSRGRIQKILEKSPERIDPPCPYFSCCGGCQLQHMSYAKQLEIKRRFVEDSLLRIGQIKFAVPPVVPSSLPFAYRRHLSFKVKSRNQNKKILQLGFTQKDGITHLPISSCSLFHSPEDPFISLLQTSFIASLSPSLFPVEFTLKIVKQAPQQYLLAFLFQTPISPEAIADIKKNITKLSCLSGYLLNTPTQFLEEGNTTLCFSYQGISFLYSPLSFVQNHPEQSALLYDWVLQHNQQAQSILDLYCGIGVLTLALALQGKEAIGVELNPQAIQLAMLNGKNVPLAPLQASPRFFCSSVESFLQTETIPFPCNAMIVNPPKTGLTPQALNLMIKKNIANLTYISCNPTTLARDLLLLQQKGGFFIQELQSFDMFPQTTHVETAVKLTRRNEP